MVVRKNIEPGNRQRALLTPTQIQSESSETFENNLVAVSPLKVDTSVVEKSSTEKTRIFKLPKHTTHQIGVRQ